MTARKLSLHGIDWSEDTASVLDLLTDRYLTAVPGATYPVARQNAEEVYAKYAPRQRPD